MSRENQIKESKELIENAMIMLLKKKELAEISMTEIANQAGVARMTLYRHFEKKEEIILNIVENKMEKLVSKMKDNHNITMYDLMYFRFTFLKKSPFTMKLHQSNHLGELLDIVRDRSIDRLQFVSEIKPNQFLLDFLDGGIDAVTAKWISEGMKIPPEDMAKRLNKIIIALHSSLQNEHI